MGKLKLPPISQSAQRKAGALGAARARALDEVLEKTKEFRATLPNLRRKCRYCRMGGYHYDPDGQCLGCLVRDLADAPESARRPRLKLLKGRMPAEDFQRLLGLMEGAQN